MKLFAHQEETAEFIAKNKRAYVADDPGCGKTIATLEGFLRTKGKRMLVLAPLSILRPAWGADIDKYAPHLSWNVARGTPNRRSEILASDTDIIITNHDAVNWLIKEPKKVLDSFDMIVIDESTTFKNRTAKRSKAAKKLTENVDKNLVLLSGTPTSITIQEIWHQVFLLDRGKRLGRVFSKFREEVCICRLKDIGGGRMAQEWEDRDDAEERVAAMLNDLMIRHKFEDCIDIPENTRRYIEIDLPASVRKGYNDLIRHASIETSEGRVNAIHAGAKYQKIMQMLTGAIYNEDGEPIKIHDDRYRLVMQLVDERPKSLVAFNWKHERDALCALADSMNIKYAVIDGSASDKDRREAVENFQRNDVRVIFAHPKSAAHGLTLTEGVATIWCSPTPSPEAFQQFNRRIYRAGQTKKTETLCVCAKNTREVEVYEKLDLRLTKMDDLLGIFVDITKLKQTA